MEQLGSLGNIFQSFGSLVSKASSDSGLYNINAYDNILINSIHAFLIRNLSKGLVLKVPYSRTSFCQILVLKVP